MPAPEPRKIFISPSNRLRLEVSGRAALEENDIAWLRFISGRPALINERLLQQDDIGGASPQRGEP